MGLVFVSAAVCYSVSVKTTEIVAAIDAEIARLQEARNAIAGLSGDAEGPSFGILTEQSHQEETHPFRCGSRENCRCTAESLGQAEEVGPAAHAIFRETICSGLLATTVLRSLRN